MSLNTMAKRMALEIPSISEQYCRTLLQEAEQFIDDSQLWSFQLKDGGWLTPGLLFPSGPGTSLGTVTYTAGSNKVIGDATASAAWAAYTGTPGLTSFQFRSPFYSLYSIVAYDTTSNPPFGTLTLDRPWMEPSGVAQSYMIYQAYFAAPTADFKRFLAVWDTTNNAPMDYWSKSQKDLATEDPQRTIFDDPYYVVPYQQDQRAGSATLGYMLYELWPHPLSQLPYTFSFLRRGNQLLLPSSTLPYPLTEEAVLWKAKEDAFLWKESQKGENVERGSGADWRFLAGAAGARFKIEIKPCKDKDRDLVDLYKTKLVTAYRLSEDGYSNMQGNLNVGRM